MRQFPRASPGAFVVLFALALFGCDEDDTTTTRADRQSLEAARQQAEQDRRRMQQLRDQDRRVLEAQRQEAGADASVAVLLWATTAIALTVAIVLIARERRLRRIMERLLRTLLGQKQERGP